MGEDELVRRIVSRAGIPSARARRELERELKAHLEDAGETNSVGKTGIDASPAICDRFGDPNEIAIQFQRLYRIDRVTRFALNSFLLLIVSVATVAALIAIMQLAAAVSLGLDPVPRHLTQQIASVIALVLGYMGTELGYGTFKRHRILKFLALDGALCASITAVCLSLSHVDPTTPLMTLAIGAGVRMLQITGMRRLWFLAAVVPLVTVTLFSRRAISAGNEVPLWGAAKIPAGA